MSKLNEVIDSLTNENAEELKETLNSEVSALQKNNSQLYVRAKKAEGFEQDKETKKWSKKEVKPEPKIKTEKDKLIKSTEITLSTGDKALLKSYKDIKGIDELALCENWLNKYKCELEEMLEDEVFNANLTKLREAKKVKDAIPSGNKRSVSSDNTAVDYWLNQPFDKVPEDMKRKVLNTRLKQDKQKSKFG